MSEVKTKALLAKKEAAVLNQLTTTQKNEALKLMADSLLTCKESIIAANKLDIQRGMKNGMSKSLIDRLTLTRSRIEAMAEGLMQIIDLPDPIGTQLEEITRPNGLLIRKLRVPIGLIGIIYEARPNVTVDAAGLCLKSGNTVVLRGGSDALESNIEIVRVLQGALQASAVPANAIQLITNSDRGSVDDLIKLNGIIDVVIPRGGHSLIQNVVKNATVPVIETGAGVCHTYIDDSALLSLALPIALNAKVQRPSVCNAMETLLLHHTFAELHLKEIIKQFLQAGVQIYGCPKTRRYSSEVLAAAEQNWGTEYNDYILNIKVVDHLDEAIAHINRYGTMHSECIVTENAENARKFMLEIDAAAVYQNASTRFTDGFEFGFGAEIGISTQKLHARGPMGLPALTSTKYCVYGNGQIRE